MKYAYTEKPVEGFAHRNPKFWAQVVPPEDATEVVVDAGNAEIIKHFEEADVKVTVQGGVPKSAADVAKLKKGELEALLKENGVEAPNGKVEELREQLTAILFPGS